MPWGPWSTIIWTKVCEAKLKMSLAGFNCSLIGEDFLFFIFCCCCCSLLVYFLLPFSSQKSAPISESTSYSYASHGYQSNLDTNNQIVLIFSLLPETKDEPGWRDLSLFFFFKKKKTKMILSFIVFQQLFQIANTISCRMTQLSKEKVIFFSVSFKEYFILSCNQWVSL